MQRFVPALVTGLLLIAPLHANEVVLESDDNKILYALGVALSRNLSMLELSEGEMELVQAGLADGAFGRESLVDMKSYGPRIDGMLRARFAAMAQRELEAGATLRAETAAEPGAITTESGLIYRELEAGEGASPGPADTVKLHYRGTLHDGKVFDSSGEGEGGAPVSFRLDAVIACFSEGLQKMKVGGRSKLTCAPDLAYGERGSPPLIRPGATLVFDVHLLDITAAGSAPADE